ncbi:uncharacterized protein LOC126095508 [Schistocerca cancellata]|uniref:uncharacterized protein LOC126095508 n=1 Tax=Schistocerca cancellata TaxID=274614 RepID=UPI002118382B|nr:uncharacterized protein LOC126095508 [Schistocerca cancellata]
MAVVAVSLLALLATYCYRVPSVLAIPDRKEGEEGEWPMRRAYRLEDFLWTGSGDGALPPQGPGASAAHAPATTTVFRTTTVLTTVFPTSTPTLVVVVVTSSPVVSPPDPGWTAEQRYWLLTVVKQPPGRPPPTLRELEARLARLYRIAFDRQQERHLGLVNATAAAPAGRLRRAPAGPVSVRLLEAAPLAGEDAPLRLVYAVSVGGRPVPAVAAAYDMRLLSDAEVSAELGMPVLTKAERDGVPPLTDKPGTPKIRLGKQMVMRWGAININGGYSGKKVELAEAASKMGLDVLAVSDIRRKRGKRRVVSDAQAPAGGADNTAFVDSEGAQRTEERAEESGRRRPSPRLPGVAPPPGPPPPVAASVREEQTQTPRRPASGSSGSSSGACSSARASLVRRRAQPAHHNRKHRHHHDQHHRRRQAQEQQQQAVEGAAKKRPRPAATSVEEPEAEDMADDGAHPVGEDAAADVPEDLPAQLVRISSAVSPNSFLSMPSIKAFPRGANIPEPLARVLEPVSVRHLDCDAMGGVAPGAARRLARHGSTGGGDPGVVGPLVWQLHCRQLQQQQQQQHGGTEENTDTEEIPEEITQPETTGSNVGHMRRRFHELLDDAFSLFGSRSESPGLEDGTSSPPMLHRVHSAIVRPVGGPPGVSAQRPHTTELRRPATASTPLTAAARPRGAWGTVEHSPLSSAGRSRPLSAGPFHRPRLPTAPEVDCALVLCDSRLAPSDPAVPLIAAIKEELQKFSDSAQPPVTLPGSTSSKT